MLLKFKASRVRKPGLRIEMKRRAPQDSGRVWGLGFRV